MAKFLVIERGKSGTITENLDLFVINVKENAEVTFDGKIRCYEINCKPGSIVYFKSPVLCSKIYLDHNVIAIFSSKTTVNELQTTGLVAIDIHANLTCFKEVLSNNTHIFFDNSRCQINILTDKIKTYSINQEAQEFLNYYSVHNSLPTNLMGDAGEN